MSLNGLLLRWAYGVAGVGTPGRLSLEGVAMRAASTYLATPVPANTVAPAITGTAQVGQVLTASDGTWSGTPTLTRQRKADGVAIPSATATTYTPVGGDVGKLLTVTVSGKNLAGTATATSAPTAAVIA